MWAWYANAMSNKYKKKLVLGAIIFLVSSLSFGFGYLANREFNHAAIVIEKCAGGN